MSCEEFLPTASELIDKAYRTALNIQDRALRDGALAAVASKAVAMNQFEKAKELLDNISDEELKIQAYRNIAVYFASRGYIHDALQIIKQIPYEESYIDALKAAISYLIPRGRINEALRIVEFVKMSEFKNELLKFTAEKMIENANLDQVSRIIESIDDPIYRASARNKYIAFLAKFGSELDASLWAKTLSDIELIRDTISIREGQTFLRVMEIVNKKLIELENLYFALVKAGSNESSRILDLIIKSVVEIQDPEDRIDTLRALVRNAAFSENPVDISPIIDMILSEIRDLENPLVVSQVLKDVSIYYLSRKDNAKAHELIKMAIETADKIEEVFQRDAFFKELVEDLLNLGVYAFLEETIKKFTEPRYRIEALCSYAMKVADAEKAKELISQSHKEIAAIKNPVWLAYLLQRILEAQILRGVGDLKRTLDILLKITDLIDSEYSKATTLASIGETLYKLCVK
ncbi:MAG: hypothetical protein NDP11_03100 [Crenarchaeota archaeon]|nr:hypothetical protein [Thermoproteota archaeon]